MSARKVLGGLGLAMLLVLSAPAVAGAADESVGGCVLEKVEKLEAAGTDKEVIRLQIEKDIERCQQSPNPILPSMNELIWAVLSFGVLFIVLWKYALPPIVKTMHARTERIRDDLGKAEAARAEAEVVVSQYQAQLADARAQSQRIIEEARQSADALKADLQRRAEADIVDLRQRAAADVAASKQQAIADLRQEVASLALGAAERVVERNLDRDTQMQLIESYINQVGSAN